MRRQAWGVAAGVVAGVGLLAVWLPYQQLAAANELTVRIEAEQVAGALGALLASETRLLRASAERDPGEICRRPPDEAGYEWVLVDAPGIEADCASIGAPSSAHLGAAEQSRPAGFPAGAALLRTEEDGVAGLAIVSRTAEGELVAAGLRSTWFAARLETITQRGQQVELRLGGRLFARAGDPLRPGAPLASSELARGVALIASGGEGLEAGRLVPAALLVLAVAGIAAERRRRDLLLRRAADLIGLEAASGADGVIDGIGEVVRERLRLREDLERIRRRFELRHLRGPILAPIADGPLLAAVIGERGAVTAANRAWQAQLPGGIGEPAGPLLVAALERLLATGSPARFVRLACELRDGRTSERGALIIPAQGARSAAILLAPEEEEEVGSPVAGALVLDSLEAAGADLLLALATLGLLADGTRLEERHQAELERAVELIEEALESWGVIETVLGGARAERAAHLRPILAAATARAGDGPGGGELRIDPDMPDTRIRADPERLAAALGALLGTLTRSGSLEVFSIERGGRPHLVLESSARLIASSRLRAALALVSIALAEPGAARIETGPGGMRVIVRLRPAALTSGHEPPDREA